MNDLESRILSVEDAEYWARRRLPRSLAQAIEVGEPERAFGRNLAAFDELALQPRAAVFHAQRDLRTTVLGHEISMPVIIAPAGNARIFHPDGEPGIARAAGAAGTIHCVSTFTGYPIEDITAAATGPVFFQLYFVGGRANAERNLDRAQRAGCRSLILTMDSAARPLAKHGAWERAFLPATIDARSTLRFLPQVLTRLRWLRGFVRDGMTIETAMVPGADGRPLKMADAANLLPTVIPEWKDLVWIRERWRGPLVVKGLLSAEDARRAVELGADAIVVSNHGGHMLPSTPATMRVLPEIVEAVGDQVEVLLDSGVRRGEDVVKAVSLGARAVLIGRGYLWAHAAAGEAGVRRILEVFRAGIDSALALLGCPSVAALDHSYIRTGAEHLPFTAAP
jgi:isopentenyl diphosphate isomerase/L-lactate dehydrogenase-like FMN-dependent dehydrogenase